MNIAVTNLSIDSSMVNEYLNFLSNNGIKGIEVAITKINNWDQISEDDIHEYVEMLKLNNIKVTSIQSIFYNTDFKDLSDFEKITSHFKRVIDYSKILNSNIIVFGSPKIRKKFNGYEDKISDIFKFLDQYCDNSGLKICIEPNSTYYGSEFFNTIDEIVDFIKNNNFKNISTMIDTHNIILENQDPVDVFSEYYKFIDHIHISENNLSSIRHSDSHKYLSNKIISSGYGKTITYEFISQNFDHFSNSVQDFINIYKKTNL